MQIKQVTAFLETIAPPSLQEAYDNAGLLTGNKNGIAAVSWSALMLQKRS